MTQKVGEKVKRFNKSFASVVNLAILPTRKQILGGNSYWNPPMTEIREVIG